MLTKHVFVAASLVSAVSAQAQPSTVPGATCTGTGPEVGITIQGLKDRRGLIIVELYPANDEDFLADDVKLLAAHKPFRRVERAVPGTGEVTTCIRAASPGRFALVVLHDRNADRRFALTVDGVGLGGNPRLRLARPRASEATISVPPTGIETTIRLNYWRGLGMRPVEGSR